MPTQEDRHYQPRIVIPVRMPASEMASSEAEWTLVSLEQERKMKPKAIQLCEEGIEILEKIVARPDIQKCPDICREVTYQLDELR